MSNKKGEATLKAIREEDVGFVARTRDATILHLRSNDDVVYTIDDLLGKQTAFSADAEIIQLDVIQDDFIGSVWYRRNAAEGGHDCIASVNHRDVGGKKGGIDAEAIKGMITEAVEKALTDKLTSLGVIDAQGKLITGGDKSGSQ